MKRLLAVATLLAFFISIIPNSYAAVTAGTKCKVIGSKKTVGSKIYTCTSGKYWGAGVRITKPTPTTNPFAAARDKAAAARDKAAAARDKAAADKAAAAGITCPINGKCEIGNKGPGGGIVFYAAPRPQSWGQYLEVAPATWNGRNSDPKALWCDVIDVSLVSAVRDPKLEKLIGTEIGKGRGNTQLMTAYCKSGAANLATAYRGGGKSDWFLPSLDELNEVHVNRTIFGGFATGYYWSSSEKGSHFAWDYYFGNGGMEFYYKYSTYYVRPVRAFK